MYGSSVYGYCPRSEVQLTWLPNFVFVHLIELNSIAYTSALCWPVRGNRIAQHVHIQWGSLPVIALPAALQSRPFTLVITHLSHCISGGANAAPFAVRIASAARSQRPEQKCTPNQHVHIVRTLFECIIQYGSQTLTLRTCAARIARRQRVIASSEPSYASYELHARPGGQVRFALFLCVAGVLRLVSNVDQRWTLIRTALLARFAAAVCIRIRWAVPLCLRQWINTIGNLITSAYVVKYMNLIFAHSNHAIHIEHRLAFHAEAHYTTYCMSMWNVANEPRAITWTRCVSLATQVAHCRNIIWVISSCEASCGWSVCPLAMCMFTHMRPRMRWHRLETAAFCLDVYSTQRHTQDTSGLRAQRLWFMRLAIRTHNSHD